MVAPVKRRSQKSTPAWHKSFLRMLPKIRSYARTAFQHRDTESREDLVQEVVANCLVAFKALWDRGKQALAFPTVLANFAIRQVRDHRRVGNRLNVKDGAEPVLPAVEGRRRREVGRLRRGGERLERGGRAGHTQRPRVRDRRLPRRFRRLVQEPPPP